MLGRALVHQLVDRGIQVLRLVGCADTAEEVRATGAVPVVGSLSEGGRWQDEAAADWVFHLPSHTFDGRRISRRNARAIAAQRVSTDAHVLDALTRGGTERLIYVSDASYYGATGPAPVTEDAMPRPTAWGRCFAPALDRLDGYVLAGLPAIIAFPGWVYGNGDWCRLRVIDPVTAGRRVLAVGTPAPWVSPIHVIDCARALIHLAERGRVGQRYFLVNDAPVRLSTFASTFGRLADRPVHLRRVPSLLAKPLVGAVLYQHVTRDAIFSASRLRGLGFQCACPTLEHGLQEVVGNLHA